MHKILPSERISNEIKELLHRGIKNKITSVSENNPEDIITLIFQKSLKKFIQEVLEEEVKDYLGRDPYERITGTENEKPIYRNGYENKNVKSTMGKMKIDVPQLRNTDEPYRSEFLTKMSTISPELENLVKEMYVRGLSTRDIEDSLKANDGSLLISRTAVSKLTQTLNEEYEEFIRRDLSSYDVIYLFADGVYESFRKQTGAKEAILCCWAILSTGHKVLLHLALGNKESYECWKEFFLDMICRGLRAPLLITTDGAGGLKTAIEECFPETQRQRCIAHKLRNIANKLNEQGRQEVLPKIREIYYQTDKETAEFIASKIVDNYASLYPSAIKCFQEDFESCITFMNFPPGHHDYIRTTNLLERSFEEQKRRTKVIPRFFDETSCIKLVFSTLIRVSEKWKKIRMKDYDLILLKKLRILYGWKDNEEGFISKKIAA